MTDARIILWFTWFVFSSWIRNLAMLSAQRFLKGTHSMRKALSLFLMFLFVAGAFLAAPKKTAAQDDPPSRVARLNFMQGSVSFEASGTQEWIDANPSRPLTTGDNLWVDKDSLGEVHVGSLAIRMASETGISFLNLDDHGTDSARAGHD